MADYYSAQVAVSNVVRTPANLDPPPTPDGTGSFAGNPPNGAYGPTFKFQAIDFESAAPFSVFSLYLTITIECSLGFVSPTFITPEWSVKETHRWDDGDFISGAVFATFFSTNGGNGAEFLSGATLKIDKDEANSKYVITGLMGNSQLLFADAPSPGPGPGVDFAGLKLTLAEGPYVYGATLVPPTPGSIVKGHAEVGFSNFYTYKNAIIHRGASLGSGQRGHWVPSPGPPTYDASYTPWLVPVGAPTYATISNPDTASTIVAGITSGADDSTPMSVFEERNWDLRFSYPIAGTKIDLIHAVEHGSHWNAYILPSAPSVVSWQRSHDKGNSWTGGNIDSSGGDADSPSINWAFGKLVAVWWNGTSIVQSFSSDFGQSWGTPVALSISGTNPRHLVDPQTGFCWYFYFDDNKLKLVRSGNFGAQFVDASPVVAIDPIDQQTVAAQLCLDGSILVSYLASGAIVQARSTDLGRSFSAA